MRRILFLSITFSVILFSCKKSDVVTDSNSNNNNNNNNNSGDVV